MSTEESYILSCRPVPFVPVVGLRLCFSSRSLLPVLVPTHPQQGNDIRTQIPQISLRMPQLDPDNCPLLAIRSLASHCVLFSLMFLLCSRTMSPTTRCLGKLLSIPPVDPPPLLTPAVISLPMSSLPVTSIRLRISSFVGIIPRIR